MENFAQWGYTEGEALFLNIISGTGGWFRASQYNTFRGHKPGNTVMQLVKKGKRKGHIRERWIGKRVLYRWLGIPPEAAIKTPDMAIRRRLIALDFVIAHLDKLRFYSCREQKQEYLLSHSDVTKAMLPAEVEHDPVFSDEGIPGFCFVDNGRKFEAWLEAYAPLLIALKMAILVYVSSHKRRIQAAKERLQKISESTQESAELEQFRLLDERYEAPEKRSAMSPEEFRQHREMKDRFRHVNCSSDRAQPGMNVVLKPWWEPLSNRHYLVFELPGSKAHADKPNSKQ